MKRLATAFVLMTALVFLMTTGLVAGEKDAKMKPFSLAKLTEKIEKLEKKEITITGTIIGVCKSGCKMWVADGEYEEGNPYALIRAKDDAFKFDKDGTGKKVILHGYAVAKYMDYCAESGKEQEGAMDECESPVKTADAKKKCDKDKETKKEPKEAAKKKTLKDVTFFATKVVYK